MSVDEKNVQRPQLSECSQCGDVHGMDRRCWILRSDYDFNCSFPPGSYVLAWHPETVPRSRIEDGDEPYEFKLLTSSFRSVVHAQYADGQKFTIRTPLIITGIEQTELNQ